VTNNLTVLENMKRVQKDEKVYKKCRKYEKVPVPSTNNNK